MYRYDKDSYKLFKKYSKVIHQIEKPSIFSNNNKLLNPYLINQSNTAMSINPFLNISHLKKIYRFVYFFLKKKGKIIFILPDEKKFDNININSKFINLLKKNNYQHCYINPSDLSIQNGPGLLTNMLRLNKTKQKAYRLRKKILIFNLNTDLIYIENIIKEATLLKIPVVGIINDKNIIASLLYPIISDINLKTILFYYFFISKILNITKI